MGIAKNRSCSINGRDYTQVQNLEIPEEGLIVHLKSFGKVKVFQKVFKNGEPRQHIIFLPEAEKDALIAITRVEFKVLHSIHWGIEQFVVRTTEAIKPHFFSAIRAFTQLELMRVEELIENWYELQRNLSLQVARDFILEHLKQQTGLNAHSPSSANA